MPNEISVDLRLKLEKLKGDARQAGKEIHDGLYKQTTYDKGLMELMAGDTEQQKKTSADLKRHYAGIAAETKRDEDVEAASRRNKARKLLREREETREEEKAAAGKKAALADAIAAGKIALAITTAFVILRKAILEMAKAADEARLMYAKILMSGGMAPGFIVRQQGLSQVLGVPERQVWQYGNAVAYLSRKLEYSSQILTRTNPVLTDVGWQFKILNQDMKAMWAQIAYEAAPALKLLAMSATGAANIITFLAKHAVPGWDALVTLLAKIAPPPTVSIDRLPSSSWERMGMVIGQIGGGTNHAKRTADNTAKMLTWEERIYATLTDILRHGHSHGAGLDNAMYPQP